MVVKTLNINQIHYFLAIVKTKSFSDAAYDLFISQSSISKQIKSLEDELGIPLFTRTSNKRTLTPAGELFYNYAKSAYELHRDMLLEMEQLKNNIVSSISVGNIPIIPMYTNFNIGVILAFFQESIKDASINFETSEASQIELLRMLHDGNIDFALVREERIPNIEDFDSQLCSSDKMVLVCKKNHPLAKKQQVSFNDIAQYQLFMLGKESELFDLIMSPFAKRNLKIKIHGESLKPKIIQGMLTSGNYVSILPNHVVDLNCFPELCTIELEETIESHVLFIRLKNRQKNKYKDLLWKFWQKYSFNK